jgi:hypothetical protein
MKILDKISLREMLKRRTNCPICLGRGYVLEIVGSLDARRYRQVRPCTCVRQVVRIEED